jgi:hypothetical protein
VDSNIKLAYDPETDVLMVNGIKFACEVFRMWSAPDDRVYQFRRKDDVLTVQQVVVCDACKEKFYLYKE